MIDALLYRRLRPILDTAAKPLVKLGISANTVTVVGFVIGLLVLPALAAQRFDLALLCIVLNRLSDGLDGAIARQTKRTDAGGYLDSVMDFIFYSAVPFGFLLADPAEFGSVAGLLMFSFMGTAATFLAFAILAGKHGIENPNYPNKSLHYMGGITEGFETIVAFIVFCLWPAAFPVTGAIFAALCWFTALTRLYLGYRTLRLLA
ncbi:CDP-alcohol phosphatidyltransferase family protein [Pseudidiomarina terrestris]|uniref:CDP-alcohol phosphatidyltransferase family protein n=1 Tax=Pseudidiomarina terrestris TaxID=2820060 RepID=A0AAW7R0T3_9GAMM|nr:MULTISPECIES: CDP-alcohol phosphatidyltransferase family protein [unclassified Pseudidiomarina]MDN7124240.1 CDP-alcohol phosphatidyltransferase family protein [Pseudidiomarina sp. 1APP75-32.1]MDN7127307.1 CDP-alcohol phosphatidyltransferase family protein [Pseudidiomarina sp. 1APR75-33.1]MDN7128497.1 CDP-alcohol phosphatidyltransferase family protein [Pseudidiomarina sp. 1APR75-15]MDN7135255.1 CDP-alcohol phosphatidyltransferase family protein [Pseudidiomarina sp. 1ASP75-5]MDN7138686.1 CDP-